MDEMNTPVFEGLACGLAPIEVFEPFDRRALDVVIAAKIGNRAAKRACAMLTEETYEIAVNLPTIDDRERSFARTKTSGIASPSIIKGRR